MRITFTILGEPGGKRYETFDRPGRIVLGRGADADLRIQSSGVAERHCHVFLEPHGARVVDLQTSGGTEVDGRRLGGTTAGEPPVLEASLSHGSEISIGRDITIMVKLERTLEEQLEPALRLLNDARSEVERVFRQFPEETRIRGLMIGIDGLLRKFQSEQETQEVSSLGDRNVPIPHARPADPADEATEPVAGGGPRFAAQVMREARADADEHARPIAPARPVASDAGAPPAGAATTPARASSGDEFVVDALNTGRIEGLPGYRVLGQIADGRVATVLDAEREHDRHRVAIKVFKPQSGSSTRLERFQQEGELLARLRHPGIPELYECGVIRSSRGDRPYHVLEFVSGRSLMEFAAERRLTIRQRLELIAAICDVLHYVHGQGVIHRGLKPANILVGDDGAPRVLDFGMARVSDSSANLTAPGQVVGTLSHLSPEQLQGSSDAVDARADVYAAGGLGYQLLTGKPHLDFTGKAVGEALRIVAKEKPRPLGELNQAYRGPIEKVFAKALEKDRERRQPSAAALAEEIREILGVPRQAAPAPGPPPAAPPPPAALPVASPVMADAPPPPAQPPPEQPPLQSAASASALGDSDADPNESSSMRIARERSRAAASVPPRDEDVIAPTGSGDFETALRNGEIRELRDYRILSVISRGRVSTVFEALDPGRRPVAIKLFAPRREADREMMNRFLQEAGVLARFDHPGVVKLLISGYFHTEHGERPYHVMELIRGRPLLVWSNIVRPDVQARVEVLIRLCDAMDYVHQRGVLHRDLKPSNVLVDDASGQPRILDFGAARLASGSPLTAPGQVIGNLNYMAPEQLAGDSKRLDERVDVYALAGIAYTLLSGRPPLDFTGMNIAQALQAIKETKPESLGDVDREYRGDLSRIVMKGLEKDPARRQRGAAALAGELRAWRNSTPLRH